MWLVAQARRYINWQDDIGRTALHDAPIESTDIAIAEALLKAGAHVWVLDRNGQSPFEVAVMEGRTDIVRPLVNTAKQRSVAMAARLLGVRQGLSAACYAALVDNAAMVRRLQSLVRRLQS